MSMKNQLSVIIPIGSVNFNISNLELTLENMSCSLLDFLLIYDGTNSNEIIAVQKIKENHKDLNISVFCGKYGGPGMARNKGLQESKTELISFWDCDDLPEVEEFLQMKDKLLLEKVDCVLGDFTYVNVRELSKRRIKLKNDVLLIGIGLEPGLWRFVFTRSSIADLEFGEYRMGEDQVFLARYLTQSRSMSVHKRNVYNYFVGFEKQLTGSKKNISEIIFAIKDTYGFLISSKDSNPIFLETLICRQIITGITKGNLTTKVLAFAIFLRFVGRICISRRWSAPIAVVKHLMHNNNERLFDEK
jgi:hypothetical protein